MTTIFTGDIAFVLSVIFGAAVVPDLTVAALKRRHVPGDDRLVRSMTRVFGCLGLALAIASSAASLGGWSGIAWIRDCFGILVGLAVVGAIFFVAGRRD